LRGFTDMENVLKRHCALAIGDGIMSVALRCCGQGFFSPRFRGALRKRKLCAHAAFPKEPSLPINRLGTCHDVNQDSRKVMIE
jgi:hypothetical protein